MIDIRIGDCLQVMPTLPENSVDTILTDPPYGLDFMGKDWDCGVPSVPFWKAALRVAKPGAILMAFGGTRTFHRLACAIEDAGWELRDMMMWLYGSGFPKSLDISKAIEKEQGVQPIGSKPPTLGMANNPQWNPCYQQLVMPPAQTDAGKLWSGYGTALKPAWEPIIVAMKPLEGTYAENAQKWGVAGLNIDGGRIGTDGEIMSVPQSNPTKRSGTVGTDLGISRSTVERFQSAQRASIERTQTLGRWPANLLLDEESARLLDEQSGELKNGGQNGTSKPRPGMFGVGGNLGATQFAGDHGGASRFFKICKEDDVCPICGKQKEDSCEHLSVSSVDESLRIIQATILSIALSDALTTLAGQYAPNVKSAGNLCDLCATSIAVALAGIKTSAFSSVTLRAILAYTGESTSSILIHNLVPFAALLASTDTIPTTESLSILFGSVSHAITSCTQETRRSEPSRFVYTSKASSSERNAGLEDCEPERDADRVRDDGVGGDNPRNRSNTPKQNFHPTVKPVDLMRYLCKLTRTPTGGVVLDPFMGSGTTGIACILEHRDFIGIEIDEKYAEIAKKRIADMEGPLFSS